MIKVLFNPAGCQNARNAEIAGIIIADIKDVEYMLYLPEKSQQNVLNFVQKCVKV